MKNIYASFNQKQILSLNDYQNSGTWHPFTCGKHSGENGVLIARKNGWACPTMGCTYKQNYAYDFMADRSWEASKNMWQKIVNGTATEEERLIAGVNPKTVKKLEEYKLKTL